MWATMKTTLALGALVAAATADAIKVELTNMCAEEFDLSHLGAGSIISVEKFIPGSSKTKEIPMGSHSQLFKAGTGAQATLAEITVSGGKVWLDISIIPTGKVGPGNCNSFDACKRLTGGHSYNYPMQILPSQGASGAFPTCKSITCMYDGCPEAYLFPDDKKTMVCPGNTDAKVIFCPGGPGGKTPEPTTPAPTTPAPTTPAPTTPEPTTSTPAPATTESTEVSFEGGFMGGSGSGNGTAAGTVGGEDRGLDLDAGVATTAPTLTETPAAPVAEAVVVAGATPPAAVQEANTKSEANESGGAGLYVMLSVGAAAMVAGSAIFVLRKKKQALEDLEQKTPRPTTTRATNAFMLTTPQETTVL